jgi:hypothetical protein
MSQKYWILGRAVKEEERSGVLSLILILDLEKNIKYLDIFSSIQHS